MVLTLPAYLVHGPQIEQLEGEEGPSVEVVVLPELVLALEELRELAGRLQHAVLVADVRVGAALLEQDRAGDQRHERGREKEDLKLRSHNFFKISDSL